jgi:uncharacterized protein YkwD
MTRVVVVFVIAGAMSGAMSLASPEVDVAFACKKAHAHARQASRRQVRRAVVCLVNHARSRHDMHKLDSSRRLKRAAKRHSRRMVERNCFAHQCPGEADLFSRVKRTGYTRNANAWSLGEAIGVEKSAIRVFRAWMHSPPHRAILLGRFADLGIGVRWGAPGRPGAHKATFTLNAGWRRR